MSTWTAHGWPGRIEHIMGMPISIDVRDPEVGPEALEQAFDWLHWVDATFSTYRADSAISQLNRGELALDQAHHEVRAVLARCEELWEETRGYFDIRAPFRAAATGPEAAQARAGEAHAVPAAVDPSGLVKGWSVERAARILETAGARSYCLNAGGDIRVQGCPWPAPYWRIGIQHPLRRDRLAAVVAASDLAIATSGAYERGAHVLDPHTGRAPQGVLSVTVVGPDLATADAYATAAYAMGRAGPAWTARLVGRGYDAMTILADQTVLLTRRFPALPPDQDEPTGALGSGRP